MLIHRKVADFAFSDPDFFSLKYVKLCTQT